MLRRAIERFLRPAPALAASLLLAACGSAGQGDADGGGADAVANRGRAASGAAASAAARRKGGDDALVAAVSSAGKPGAPVELSFDLLERPEVGRPVAIAVVVTPRGPGIDALEVSFQSGEGVDVTSGAALGRRSKPADGEPIHHELTVVPQRDGVFYVSAVALVESTGGSIARSFSIPIIVGGGAAASAAIATKSSAAGAARATTDASGEPIVSMPAAESR